MLLHRRGGVSYAQPYYKKRNVTRQVTYAKQRSCTSMNVITHTYYILRVK